MRMKGTALDLIGVLVLLNGMDQHVQNVNTNWEIEKSYQILLSQLYAILSVKMVGLVLIPMNVLVLLDGVETHVLNVWIIYNYMQHV